jgi:hypothetical protein
MFLVNMLETVQPVALLVIVDGQGQRKAYELMNKLVQLTAWYMQEENDRCGDEINDANMTHQASGTENEE